VNTYSKIKCWSVLSTSINILNKWWSKWTEKVFHLVTSLYIGYNGYGFFFAFPVFECVCALSRAFLFGGIIIKYDPLI
jgi:hypothetical protein